MMVKRPGAIAVFFDLGQSYIEKERTAVNNIAKTINAKYKTEQSPIILTKKKTIYPKIFTLVEHKGSQIGKYEDKKLN